MLQDVIFKKNERINYDFRIISFGWTVEKIVDQFEKLPVLFINKLKTECGYQFTSKLDGMFIVAILRVST